MPSGYHCISFFRLTRQQQTSKMIYFILFYFPYINEATSGLQDILDQDKFLYDFCHESEK